MMSIGSGLTLLISLLFILCNIDSASPDITIFARCLTHRDYTGLVSVAHCCLRQFLTHMLAVILCRRNEIERKDVVTVVHISCC